MFIYPDYYTATDYTSVWLLDAFAPVFFILVKSLKSHQDRTQVSHVMAVRVHIPQGNVFDLSSFSLYIKHHHQIVFLQTRSHPTAVSDAAAARFVEENSPSRRL